MRNDQIPIAKSIELREIRYPLYSPDTKEFQRFRGMEFISHHTIPQTLTKDRTLTIPPPPPLAY